MKPMFEKVVTAPNSSWKQWCYFATQLDYCWHYHPEYEIALTLNSSGQRFVGDHVSSYFNADMVMVGPNLPHTWASEINDDGSEQQIYVFQIPASWLESLVNSNAELASLVSLLQMSKRGISFSTKCIDQVTPICKQLINAPIIARLPLLITLLAELQADTKAQLLASENYKLELLTDASSEKLDLIVQYIYQHYCKPLKAEQVAALVNMSTNHFHRFLKQRTEQTFTELVNQLRIGKACSLLINSNLPIALISEQCGFNNISNFNRRFLQHKTLTPRQFRKENKGIAEALASA